MKEIGEVTEVSKNFAVVKLNRKDECDKCGMCGMKKDMAYALINATNSIKAKEGDKVEVETVEKTKILAIFMVFLIPLILLAVGVIIGAIWIKNELYTLLLCLIMVVLWYTILGCLDKKISKNKNFCPKITKIVNKEEVVDE